MYDQSLAYFEIVSPLCWKHSCSAQLDSAWCAKCRKIANCSSADTYHVSSNPPSSLSTSKSLLNTYFPIPISFLNLSGCPSCSSSTHYCLLRTDVCCMTFSKQDAYANAEAYPAIITVIPANSAMCLLVSLSRDINFDNKYICTCIRVQGIWLASASANRLMRSNQTEIQMDYINSMYSSTNRIESLANR